MRTLATAPAEAVVSTAEAKEFLRVEHSDEDALIASLVSAATGYFDAEFGVLGRALVTQTWQQTGPYAGQDWPLTPAPVQAVTSVTYLDPDGDTQTLAAENYRLVKGSQTARIEWVGAIPATQSHPEAFTATYTAGFGAASDVPDGIKQAILLLTAHWYENRGVVSRGTISAPLAFAVDALTAQYRVGSAHI